MANKRIISLIAISAFCWQQADAISLNLSSLKDNAVSNIVNSISSKIPGGSLGLPSIFGDTSATIKCRSDDMLTGSLKTPDACSVNDKISQFQSKFANQSLDLGFCTLNMNKNMKCEAEELKRLCSQNVQRPASQIASSVRTGQRGVNQLGQANLMLTGADKTAKNTLCQDASTAISKFPDHFKAQNDVTALSGTGAYGNIVNTRKFMNSSECYEAALKAGKSPSDIKRSCTPYAIGASTSGMTAKDIKDNSIKMATEGLQTPLTKSATNASVDEAAINNKLTTQCAQQFTTQAEIQACAENILNNDINLADKESASIAKIEVAEAAKKGLFDEATAHRKMITHPTQQEMDELPIKMRASYAGASKRAMAQQALIASYQKNIADIKKELMTLMYQKKEIMSRPFYGKAESASIESAITVQK